MLHKDDNEQSNELISKGCTTYPIVCSFYENTEYLLETMKGSSILETFKSTDCKEIADAINRINSSNENSDLEYISLQIPNSAILNKDTSFIKEVKIIDMIGIPDPENTRANRLNSNIIDNIGLDCSFILKREEGRGKIQPQDLIDQKDSNIFRSRKYLSDQIIQPKLIGVKINNLKQNSRSAQAMTTSRFN